MLGKHTQEVQGSLQDGVDGNIRLSVLALDQGMAPPPRTLAKGSGTGPAKTTPNLGLTSSAFP